MALYAYVKAPPKRPSKIGKICLSSKFLKLVSVSLMLTGIIVLGQVIVPIAGWYFFVLPTYEPAIVSPLASSFVVKAYDLVAPQSVTNSYKPSTWFPGTKQPVQKQVSLKTYTLTIPKLKIDGATVEIGGDDLKKSLIAWPTSGIPGAYGNAVIFGHSALPQISTPTNYSTIFTFIMDLNEGDEMFVDFDGVRYKYIVVDKKVVEPDDLSVLEQRFDASYITLITCVPPGTTWKRGIIVGKLVNFN